MQKTLSMVLAGSVSLVMASTAAAGVHWGYEGEISPEHWSELAQDYNLCATGKNQSPINITNTYLPGNPKPIEFSYKITAEDIIDNGHTLQISISSDNNYLVYNGDKYVLKQFHFHTPSENTIDGKFFPLEAHFVHADADGKLLVSALMFEEGEANSELEKILSEKPSEADKHIDLKKPIDINRLLPEDSHHYHFQGSLTTPPCTENVTWIVMKKAASISADQIKAFQETLHGHNNRPVQALNDRHVDEE